ncbi:MULTISPECIES: protein-L-isoaspartate(D-aspartate) O-methyltransferase [Afifella]|uniref:protein-L-isoaspartate(D-aspartate) O-methyltransferase n=1 Tax=Afifella TaxID=643217 RepID=UPI00196AF619|nr:MULTISPECIES: protein-L-isoaspartate(D-aspartate) O-methyltransferase [Afifella]MCT8265774.1 protein-L-isoaspartate(D-aspartate) O-methyltransferase [Afifella sp. JA880]
MNDDPAIEPDPEARVRLASLILRLRELGISDRKVLGAIETVPREAFVPDLYRDDAYLDRALPIECGQTISAPSVVAMMTAALELEPRHHVLEIGTGSGYQAAILARLSRRVTTLERYRTLLELAQTRWDLLGITNIAGIVADGSKGWPTQAPFDRILVTAAAAVAPAKLVAQLVDGGILVAPVGPVDAVQRLTLFRKEGTRVDTRDLGAVRFVPLIEGIARNL